MTIVFTFMVLWVCFIVYKITGDNEYVAGMVGLLLFILAMAN